MKLKEYDFDSIWVRALSVYDGDKEIVCDFIGPALRQIPKEYFEREIKSTNYFFDIFVIRL